MGKPQSHWQTQNLIPFVCVILCRRNKPYISSTLEVLCCCRPSLQPYPKWKYQLHFHYSTPPLFVISHKQTPSSPASELNETIKNIPSILLHLHSTLHETVDSICKGMCFCTPLWCNSLSRHVCVWVWWAHMHVLCVCVCVCVNIAI